MDLKFELPVADDAAYSKYELELVALGDFLLGSVGHYIRMDYERAERSPSLRTRFNRTHTFSISFLDRSKAAAASRDIARYIQSHFGRKPVFPT
jgi:hypothetical protein